MDSFGETATYLRYLLPVPLSAAVPSCGMTTDGASNPVLRVPVGAPADAAAYFLTRLTFHTDVADVHAALESGRPGFVLVDSRGAKAWRRGFIPGAVHLPTALIPSRAEGLLDRAVPVVTYCWGPGCDGAARAAWRLAELGYRVKEMLGGLEYWIREGFPVQTDRGVVRRPADPLTSLAGSPACDC
jgi:rhodanese-related sulfurtransferase